MFYMGSVFFYLKARIIAQSSKLKAQSYPLSAFSLQPSAFYVLSIICGLLAFMSKQNAASLPLMILFVEYLLFDRTWQVWKRKLTWLIPAFLFFGVFILYVSGFFRCEFQFAVLLEDVSGLTRDPESVSRWRYLCTQFNAIVIYIRLLFLPIGQNLDYMYPFKSGFFDGFTPLAFLFLVGIVAAGLWNIKRRPVISFGIFWFFVTLSVESSIFPIRDALFEHRLYLPMFGFALLAAYFIGQLLSGRRSWILVISSVVIISLGTATYLRNRTWQDAVTLWTDVVSKSPHNWTAHHNLGLAREYQRRFQEAIRHYSEALRIKPDYPKAHNNLGGLLARQRRFKEAIQHYYEALRINPRFAEAHSNLGVALWSNGRLEEAVEHYTRALQIKPGLAETHNNLGVALSWQGKMEEAVAHFSEALRIKPDYSAARRNLQSALRLMKK
jgi:Flp pilus assembly protein TadD